MDLNNRKNVRSILVTNAEFDTIAKVNAAMLREYREGLDEQYVDLKFVLPQSIFGHQSRDIMIRDKPARAMFTNIKFEVISVVLVFSGMKDKPAFQFESMYFMYGSPLMMRTNAESCNTLPRIDGFVISESTDRYCIPELGNQVQSDSHLAIRLYKEVARLFDNCMPSTPTDSLLNSLNSRVFTLLRDCRYTPVILSDQEYFSAGLTSNPVEDSHLSSAVPNMGSVGYTNVFPNMPIEPVFQKDFDFHAPSNYEPNPTGNATLDSLMAELKEMNKHRLEQVDQLLSLLKTQSEMIDDLRKSLNTMNAGIMPRR